MILTFFNYKEGCGKSTLTLLVAKALSELFFRTNDQAKVYIFDTACSVKNSLFAKKSNETKEEFINDNKQLLFIEYASNLENFETQKKELNIKEDDIIFFDLQEFGENQLDFIANSDYVFIVSDNPNELESFDREMYAIINKLTDSVLGSNIKKIFLTQNRVSKKEHIIPEFEDINYIEGLGILPESYQIENIKIYQTSLAKPIQQFAIEIWKAVNNQEKQIII